MFKASFQPRGGSAGSAGAVFNNIQQLLLKAGASAILAAAFACAPSGSNKSGDPASGTTSAPIVSGPVIQAGSIPEGQGQAVLLSSGVTTYIQMRGGKPFFQAQGTFTDQAYAQLRRQNALKPKAEKDEVIRQEIKRIATKLEKSQAVELYEAPEVGYFVFQLPYNNEDLFAATKAIDLPYAVVMSPVPYKDGQDGLSLPAPQSMPGLEGRKLNARSDSRGFTGLSAIHAPEFVKLAEAEIGGGVKVDGSSVRVGVADSGVTLNHPSLKGRIVRLQDFTKEGRVYFNRNAKFEVTPVPPAPGSQVSEDILVSAEVVITPRLPSVPVGDMLAELQNLHFKVSPELMATLINPGSGAKLGLLDEEVFQAPGSTTDISGNGTLNTKILMILIPGSTPQQDVVYVDPTGTGDFRHSKPIGDWNLTHATVPSFSEALGFTFDDDLLPSKTSPAPVKVRSAALVGFDPGEHGTHVSGLIAGTKFIANDKPDTLARGVAPAATLAVDRVCSNNGHCQMGAALVDLAIKGQVEVINLSLGGLGALNDGTDVDSILINRLTAEKNVLFVVAAGNSGPGRQTAASPSVASAALSVGATATRRMIQRQYQWVGSGSGLDETDASSMDSDFMLYFSSRGPSGSGAFKPDLTAPGAELSSVPLNTAVGSLGGVSIMWGTSMASPTATGAYALFLDAIKKYNLANPTRVLPTDVATLRSIFIHSARPFDVNAFDSATGTRSKGQYTWIDEGTGMIDLVAAWKKLLELRNKPMEGTVTLNGKPVVLEYEILTSMVSPAGVPYDGTRGNLKAGPMFGKGLYLNYFGTETNRQVNIARKLPSALLSTPDAGNLMTQLETTQEEFVLKTVLYGSDLPWLKVSSLDETDCDPKNLSDTANLLLVGEGARVDVMNVANGTGVIKQLRSSAVNFCLDRNRIANELPPGDHGALIYGYRLRTGEQGSEVDVLPAFTIPVYLTVPNHTLANSTAYDVRQDVRSFQVQRNYVAIPAGTTLVRVTLEVDPVKVGKNGLPTRCSGVEFMPLAGSNRANPFRGSAKGIVANCNPRGEPRKVPAAGSAAGNPLKVSFVVEQPKEGIWDLPVMGFFQFPLSSYHLRVDYLTADTNISSVQGGIAALNGHFKLNLKESTFSPPDVSKSSIEINELASVAGGRVGNREMTFVAGPSGMMRSYPKGTGEVTIKLAGERTLGGKLLSQNDLDLFIYGCPKPEPVAVKPPSPPVVPPPPPATPPAPPSSSQVGISTPPSGTPVPPALPPGLVAGEEELDDEDSSVGQGPLSPDCVEIGKSDGPTDREEVKFHPQEDEVYVVQVRGADVKDHGKFGVLEILSFPRERGQISIAGGATSTSAVGEKSEFNVGYSFTENQLGKSNLLRNELFLSKKYFVKGSVRIVSEEGQVLYALPVTIYPAPPPPRER